MDDQRREQPDTTERDTERETERETGRDAGRDAGPAAEQDRQRDTEGDTGRAVGGVAEDELRPQGGSTVASGADTRDADRRPTDNADADADAGSRPSQTRDADSDDSDDDSDDSDDSEDDSGRRPGAVDDAEQQRSAEEFAREHDPAKHDVAAGADARQPGDWTADEAGGPQVWDADGKLVEGDAPGLQSSQRAEGTEQSGEAGEPGGSGDSDEPGDSGDSGGSGDSGESGASGGRTSSLDEVRDGGYGVGSAATIDDGAMPLGHPVKAWEDTKTFVSPGHDQYDAEPHLWFTDDGAASRAGFHPAP